MEQRCFQNWIRFQYNESDEFFFYKKVYKNKRYLISLSPSMSERKAASVFSLFFSPSFFSETEAKSWKVEVEEPRSHGDLDSRNPRRINWKERGGGLNAPLSPRRSLSRSLALFFATQQEYTYASSRSNQLIKRSSVHIRAWAASFPLN